MTSESSPVPRSVTIIAVSPWSTLNEYEGEVEVALGDQRLHCRVVLPSGQWDTVRLGDRVTAALWLARTGDAALVDTTAATLHHVRGVEYEAIGRVERIDDEWLQLACGMLLDVDLELTRELRQRLHVAPGAHLRVVGALQLDLDPG